MLVLSRSAARTWYVSKSIGTEVAYILQKWEAWMVSHKLDDVYKLSLDPSYAWPQLISCINNKQQNENLTAVCTWSETVETVDHLTTCMTRRAHAQCYRWSQEIQTIKNELDLIQQLAFSNLNKKSRSASSKLHIVVEYGIRRLAFEITIRY